MGKLNVFVIAILAGAAPLLAQAGVTVYDPGNLLSILDQSLGTLVFQDAFRCGDLARTQSLIQGCQFFFPGDNAFCLYEVQDPPATRVVTDCRPERVSVASDDGSSRSYTRDGYRAVQGDLVREQLLQLDQVFGEPGEAELTDLLPSSYSLSDGTRLSTWELRGRYHLPGGSVDFSYQIGQDVPAIAQVLSFTTQGRELWFRTLAIRR